MPLVMAALSFFLLPSRPVEGSAHPDRAARLGHDLALTSRPSSPTSSPWPTRNPYEPRADLKIRISRPRRGDPRPLSFVRLALAHESASSANGRGGPYAENDITSGLRLRDSRQHPPQRSCLCLYLLIGMVIPPSEIDGMKVSHSLPHRSSSSFLPLLAGIPPAVYLSGPPQGWRSVRNDGNGSYYLFGCDEHWHSISDTWHETPEGALAKDQAQVRVRGYHEDWQAIDQTAKAEGMDHEVQDRPGRIRRRFRRVRPRPARLVIRRDDRAGSHQRAIPTRSANISRPWNDRRSARTTSVRSRSKTERAQIARRQSSGRHTCLGEGKLLGRAAG